MLKIVEYRHEKYRPGDPGHDLGARFETRDEARPFLASHLERVYPAKDFEHGEHEEQGTWWVRGKLDKSFYRRFAIEDAAT